MCRELLNSTDSYLNIWTIYCLFFYTSVCPTCHWGLNLLRLAVWKTVHRFCPQPWLFLNLKKELSLAVICVSATLDTHYTQQCDKTVMAQMEIDACDPTPVVTSKLPIHHSLYGAVHLHPTASCGHLCALKRMCACRCKCDPSAHFS